MARLSRIPLRLISSEDGSTAAFAAMGMFALLGMVALAVDVGMMLGARTDSQRVADSAALAGAASFITAPTDADRPRTWAIEYATKNRVHGVTADVRPEDVDMVVMTHAHRDHVGWNLLSRDGKYTPTFPNARYYVSAKDWEACHNPDLIEARFPNAPECVWPLEDLGVLELMEDSYQVTHEITALATPGHTPGHMSIVISSQGEKALILGDVLHNPVQAHETDWVSRADMDPEQTRITRRSMMERLEQEGTLVAAVHMPAPGFGKIVRLEGRRYWQAL